MKVFVILFFFIVGLGIMFSMGNYNMMLLAQNMNRQLHEFIDSKVQNNTSVPEPPAVFNMTNTTIMNNISIPEPVTVPVKKRYNNWASCARASSNRTQDLFDQLISVRNIFEKHDISHFINFGTLIGLKRHGGMNPFEGDNDVFIEDTIDLQALSNDFEDNGLLLFKYDIWRVCTLSTKSFLNTPPWAGSYVPYTDIYQTTFHPFRDKWTNNWIYSKKWEIKKQGFADTYMYVPSFAKELLEHKYGKGWKNNIPSKKKYDK